jgi:hypothetical protein
MKSDAKKERKKKYHRPKLLVFGSIKQLTRTTGTVGKNDKGSGSTKTGF